MGRGMTEVEILEEKLQEANDQIFWHRKLEAEHTMLCHTYCDIFASVARILSQPNPNIEKLIEKLKSLADSEPEGSSE